MYEHDTIAAIATPPGQGGIAVIRVSGADAESIVRQLFLPRPSWEKLHSHHFYLGRILDQPNGQPIDHAGLILMRSPHSYTGEHIAELHLHGGSFLTRRILETILNQGARPAQPGEFTRRAFLNGRLDLIQAEAVLDLIHANNETGLHLAWEGLSGRLSQACSAVRDRLITQTAYLEAFIDFPEDDIPEHSQQELSSAFSSIRSDIEALAATFSQGKVYRDGIRTAIIGKPNVGKSSLLNLLADTERAIVTQVPGTTRDVLEESVLVNGLPLVVRDTAGIRRTTDEIEKIGIERSLSSIEQAEIVLALFDLSRPFDADDALICEKIQGKKFVLVGNKSDLPQRFDVADLLDNLDTEAPQRGNVSSKSHKAVDRFPLLHTAARYGTGIDDLGDRIQEVALGKQQSGVEGEGPYKGVMITKIRHKVALEKAAKSLKGAEQGLAAGLPLDLVAVDLRASLDHIGVITGQVSSEEILDRVFQDFCIGK